MGNLVDSMDAAQPAEGSSTDSDYSSSSDSQEFNADEIIIDLDAPEYHEYLKHKRKISRSEGNLNDISYLQWMKTNHVRRSQGNLHAIERTPEQSEADKAQRRRSAPVIGELFPVAKKNSPECENRAFASRQRIKDIKKKYKLKERDYAARTYVWNEEDEAQIRKEREERKKLRQEIRNKYNLTPTHQRTTAVASG